LTSGVQEDEDPWCALGFELDYELHLDWRVERQLCYAHGGAGVQAGLSE
jgi:hypothetical protein